VSEVISPGDLPAVSFRHLSKTFPGQRALVDVSFDVAPAEIHALLGENGSGKSTLIKILAGIHHPDAGAEIHVFGEQLPLGSPRDSRRLGLQFVHQALGIIDELTAVENIALGFGYRRHLGRLIDWRAQRRKTSRLLDMLSVEFDIDVPVGRLRAVDRSAVAIARALDDDDGACRVLVMDEPTAALPPTEVDSLFALLRRAQAAGTAIIYVSHRLNEILDLADRATILRDGALQKTVSIASTNRAGLVDAIVGRAVSERLAEAPAERQTTVESDVALRVEEMNTRRLKNVSFVVRTGEVVGIAGLTGSGREELAGALVGENGSQVRITTGRGAAVNPTPRRAKKIGLVLVLPNRAAGAATKELTIRENLTLPALERYGRFGLVRRGAELRDTNRWISSLDIRPRDPERAYALLSGGNQQKVAFGKWLNLDPLVLVAEDPTSGVDVGARGAIYDLIRAQAAKGMSFVVASSDTEDLLALCDRILVLRDGELVDELGPDRMDEMHLLTSIVGTTEHPARAASRTTRAEPSP